MSAIIKTRAFSSFRLKTHHSVKNLPRLGILPRFVRFQPRLWQKYVTDDAPRVEDRAISARAVGKSAATAIVGATTTFLSTSTVNSIVMVLTCYYLAVFGAVRAPCTMTVWHPQVRSCLHPRWPMHAPHAHAWYPSQCPFYSPLVPSKTLEAWKVPMEVVPNSHFHARCPHTQTLYRISLMHACLQHSDDHYGQIFGISFLHPASLGFPATRSGLRVVACKQLDCRHSFNHDARESRRGAERWILKTMSECQINVCE